MTKLIDVSEHNGWIDWQAVKDAGWHAIIRVGYGDDYEDQDDAYAIRNMDECDRLGIPYGVYIYSYAQSISQAQSEAYHVLRMIKGRKLSYPVYWDTEERGTEWISFNGACAFGDIIEANGYWCGVYASRSWWQSNLVGLERFTKWVAAWGGDGPGMDCDMWQYTSDEIGPGCSKRTDCNISYRDFPAEIAGGQPANESFKAVDTTRVDKFCQSMYHWCLEMDMHYGQGNPSFPLPRYDFSYGGSTDCSAMAAHCLNEAGYHVPYDVWSGNIADALVADGWSISYSEDYPPKGAVLVNYQNHVAMWDGDCIIEFGWDPHYGYVPRHGFYDYPWDCYVVPPVDHDDGKLRRGDEGEEVAEWQRKLESIGWEFKDHGGCDGIFGEHTEYVVRCFQEKTGCLVDGVIGDETKGAIDWRVDTYRTLQLWRPNWSAAQRFVEEPVDDNYCVIRQAYGPKRVMDVKGSCYDNGNPVIAYENFHGGDNQQWHIRDHGDGLVSFHPKGYEDMALDAYASTDTEGDKLIIYEFHGGANQLWHRIVNADGTLSYRTSQDSKMAIDIYGAGWMAENPEFDPEPEPDWDAMPDEPEIEPEPEPIEEPEPEPVYPDEPGVTLWQALLNIIKAIIDFFAGRK